MVAKEGITINNNTYLTSYQLIKVLNKAINSVDFRFLEHGNRVTYIMLNLMKASEKYTNEDMLKICITSIFHDIGAYKVTERDQLSDADRKAPINHAIYGALFIKNFSPLSKYYKIILAHHFTLEYYNEHNMEIISDLGLLLSFADYIDRVKMNDYKINVQQIKQYYPEEYIQLYNKADSLYDFMNKLSDGRYINDMEIFFKDTFVSKEEVMDYCKMLAYAIDFRSEDTVIHTIMVEAISEQLAKRCYISDERISLIKICALLHDIGKISIPVEILEKPGKLTYEEFEIMKNHSKIGYDILSELNMNEIRDIATLHHEKLDGSGYPFGLKGDEITKEMRIVAISDIISALIGSRSYKEGFSKEKIISILNEMVVRNKIDNNITRLFINNYDCIIDEAMKACANTMEKYLNIKNEYEELLKIYK